MMAKATNVEASPPLIHIRVVVLGRRQVGKTVLVENRRFRSGFRPAAFPLGIYSKDGRPSFRLSKRLYPDARSIAERIPQRPQRPLLSTSPEAVLQEVSSQRDFFMQQLIYLHVSVNRGEAFGNVCGSAAITVRYLTKRFIGEYKSFTDLLYRQAVCLDDTWTQVEILDTSTNQVSLKTAFFPGKEIGSGERKNVWESSKKDIRSFPWHHVRWADACVVVYSIESLQSFHEAIDIIEKIKVCKGSSKGRPLMLLANKKDLEHLRQVPARDGELASLHYGCRFSEVSAAEEVWEARTAYEAIIRDAKSWKFNENLPSRPRKLSMMSVSRMLNNMLKKTSFPPLITRKAEVVPVPDPEDRPPHPKALLQHQNQQQRTRKKGLVGHRPMTLTASDPVNELPFHSPS
ncbi:unnamed protein product [Darwinula stevensoni]|uniref:small monomeric GTPase n=1 Tax=Darwinula stevensoni TaxID=69355 RepID=A0A7R8WXZ8_9CRUS|nr:unnamed protein product [Darwinula stevensoni]CAG0878882.1 unnamed protein product [Darwinula stevensoni]